MFQLEERRVPGFDDDGGERELGEALQLERERSVGECGGEVFQALALNCGEQAPVGRVDSVVADGNGCPYGLCSLLGEAVGVAAWAGHACSKRW